MAGRQEVLDWLRKYPKKGYRKCAKALGLTYAEVRDLAKEGYHSPEASRARAKRRAGVKFGHGQELSPASTRSRGR